MAAGSNQRKLDLKDLPILRRLGQGHSGYLYKTEWDGKKCARKDFPLGSVELNRVFESEIQHLFNLDHPNIVKCFGYTLGKSSCSLVQEYVEANLQNTIQSRIEEQRKKSSRRTSTSTRVFDVDEIKRLVSSRGKKKETATTDEGSSRCPRPTPFEGPEAIAIISQIATGMKYLHNNQVVHGDLKPRNVLVYSESGERKVKLADFGLFEIKKRITLVSERSRDVETLTWKAPECLEEEEVLGPSIVDLDKDSAGSGEKVGDFRRSKLAMADVYSFGLTCSYILGGKLMYPDMNLTKSQERSSIPKVPSACPEYLKLMIDSCLQFDPCSRPIFTTISNWIAQQQYVAWLPKKTTEGVMPMSLQGPHDMNHPVDLGSLTPSRGRALKKEDRIPQWGYHETKEFISIRAELEKDFTQTKRNKTLWELIERKMKEKGYRRSADQCECKWKKLVNRYKGKETSEPDYEFSQGKDPADPENGRPCPFFDELDAIFKERAKNSERLLLEAEPGSRGKKKGKRSKTKSSDEDSDEDDDEESEEDRVVRRKKRKNEKDNNRPRVTAEKYRANSMQEVLEDFFQQQQRVEEQWRESVERREQERRMREQEWRDAMEKLEQERITRELMWREREEQRRARDEARAQKRDDLFAALLSKLAQDEGY